MKEEIEKIRKEFNDKLDQLIKPKYEVGKWWATKEQGNSKWLMFRKSKTEIYGFNWRGEFFKRNCDSFSPETDFQKYEPSQSEVLGRLTQEAIKKGYKDETIIKWRFDEHEVVLEKKYMPEMRDKDFYYMGCLLMKDGVWAEIVEEKNEAIEFAEFLKKIGFCYGYTNINLAYEKFKNK